MKAVPLPDEWHIPTLTRAPPRWVLRVDKGKVYYSTGGSYKRFCLVTTFQRWVRRTQARRNSTPGHASRQFDLSQQA